ncbi:hypothetical protein GCM10007933_35370 [Zoogloea oryzae]|uniref:Chemotaxis protein n=1 Tax=Zoogloea oryzae TaxID=310767 RepID=A0ABQ6FFH8_9RHOO|nr:hypothetical protein [Zoogloea oryzae]GLT24066.1 hypothetical protein GCM10007933_35370 [Zoogloea oryzae]
MPVPWSALFSAIPWTDVIAKAPELAQGARKLWQKVGKREATQPAPPEAPASSAPSFGERIDALDARLADVGARQQESAELLAALATQNAELIRATEELRSRVRQLGIGFVVLAAGLLGTLGLLLIR